MPKTGQTVECLKASPFSGQKTLSLELEHDPAYCDVDLLTFFRDEAVVLGVPSAAIGRMPTRARRHDLNAVAIFTIFTAQPVVEVVDGLAARPDPVAGTGKVVAADPDVGAQRVAWKGLVDVRSSLVKGGERIVGPKVKHVTIAEW